MVKKVHTRVKRRMRIRSNKNGAKTIKDLKKKANALAARKAVLASKEKQ
jgi:hypothetical protein